MNKGIWLELEEETTACSYLTDCNFKPFICFVWYYYLIFVCFRKVATPLFDRNEASLWSITKRHGHGRFESSTKVNEFGYGIHWNLCERQCPYLLQKSNRHWHADFCSCWSYSDSDPYCDCNIKRANETYAAQLGTNF